MLASVTNHLRSLILGRRFRPGERLVQNELANHLGVSRKPIREALRKRASAGLVTLSPYKGAMAAELSFRMLKKSTLPEWRLIATSVAWLPSTSQRKSSSAWKTSFVRWSRRYHRGSCGTAGTQPAVQQHVSYAASRQPRLYELTVEYIHLVNLYRRVHFSVEPLAAEEVAGHRALLASLRQRDPEPVARLTRVQIQRSVTALREFIEDI